MKPYLKDLHITYTDYVALLTSSLKTIVNGISYVLIAFVAISLIVSCIMIGIITHISVWKERRRLVFYEPLVLQSAIFHRYLMQDLYQWLLFGLLGIGVSLLTLIPINTIIQALTGITDLSAKLPINASFVLIIISIIITVIGGFLPAKQLGKTQLLLYVQSNVNLLPSNFI